MRSDHAPKSLCRAVVNGLASVRSNPLGDAVRSAVQMDREVAAVAWLDFEFPFEAQLSSATSGSQIKRPPISHNRRQAALCVWQN